MRIVSSQTEAQIKAERAKADFEYALRETTANLLRVIRGAGRPFEVAQQIKKCAEAIQAHELAIGLSIGEESVTNALGIPDEVDWRRFGNDERERHYAQETMVRGALQMTASKLLGQRTQEAAGESELYQGLREIERLRDEARRQMRAAEAAPRFKPKKNRRLKQSMPKTPAPDTPPLPAPMGRKKPAGHKAVLAAYKAARGIE
jgi:hypothetical protein